MILFADGEQPDPRVFRVEDQSRVEVAHHGELSQHVRRDVYVGPDVKHDGGFSLDRRENGGEGRTVDAFHHATNGFGHSHHGAGVAGADHPLRVAVASEPKGDADGTIPFRAQSFAGAVVHGDDLTGVMDGNGQLFPARMRG